MAIPIPASAMSLVAGWASLIVKPHGSSTKSNHPILNEEGAHSPSELGGNTWPGGCRTLPRCLCAPQELIFGHLSWHQLQLRPTHFVQRWKIKFSWAGGASDHVFLTHSEPAAGCWSSPTPVLQEGAAACAGHWAGIRRSTLSRPGCSGVKCSLYFPC